MTAIEFSVAASEGAAPDFYTQHGEVIERVFGVAYPGRPYPQTLDGLVEDTQPWVKGDHLEALNPVQTTAEQREQVLADFHKLNMTEAVIPPGGVYDHVIILGGMMRANYERTAFTHAQLNRTEDPMLVREGGSIVFWGGPREANTEKEAIPTTRLLDEIHSDVVSAEPWVQRQRELSVGQRVHTETDQGRLSLLRYFGPAAVASQIHLRLGSGKPLEQVSHYVMRNAPVSNGELQVINAPSVSRAQMQGKDRHTTKSCAEEWLTMLNGSQPERVLFVTSNPYVQRTTNDVRRVLQEAGMGSVELVGCGPAAYDDAPSTLFFGELGRMLWNVRKERLDLAAQC